MTITPGDLNRAALDYLATRDPDEAAHLAHQVTKWYAEQAQEAESHRLLTLAIAETQLEDTRKRVERLRGVADAVWPS